MAAFSWNLEEFSSLKNQFNTYVNDLEQSTTAIKNSIVELKSVWNTTYATTFYQNMEDFFKNLSITVSTYGDVSQLIETKCKQLEEIN